MRFEPTQPEWDEEDEHVDYEDWEDCDVEEYFSEDMIEALDFDEGRIELMRRYERSLDEEDTPGVEDIYEDAREPVEPDNEDLSVDVVE